MRYHLENIRKGGGEPHVVHDFSITAIILLLLSVVVLQIINKSNQDPEYAEKHTKNTAQRP